VRGFFFCNLTPTPALGGICNAACKPDYKMSLVQELVGFGLKPSECLIFNCPDLKVGAIDVRDIKGFSPVWRHLQCRPKTGLQNRNE